MNSLGVAAYPFRANSLSTVLVGSVFRHYYCSRQLSALFHQLDQNSMWASTDLQLVGYLCASLRFSWICVFPTVHLKLTICWPITQKLFAGAWCRLWPSLGRQVPLYHGFSPILLINRAVLVLHCFPKTRFLICGLPHLISIIQVGMPTPLPHANSKTHKLGLP